MTPNNNGREPKPTLKLNWFWGAVIGLAVVLVVSLSVAGWSIWKAVTEAFWR